MLDRRFCPGLFVILLTCFPRYIVYYRCRVGGKKEYSSLELRDTNSAKVYISLILRTSLVNESNSFWLGNCTLSSGDLGISSYRLPGVNQQLPNWLGETRGSFMDQTRKSSNGLDPFRLTR
ncbi:hypothetical protein F4811DRAFT_37147 [Daldinia bambusicola]|nr:hypothetical protein F4811DRAFT_37147 [Daldinia bambusicola]